MRGGSALAARSDYGCTFDGRSTRDGMLLSEYPRWCEPVGGLVARCLASLAPEVDQGRAEVWVVDNASEDGSPDLVSDRFDWVHLIASSENLGFGRAINLVARQTSSEWLATANADIALRPGALEVMLAAGERDPGAGAIAPRLAL